jgi:pepF/M3 family oligoendopeptidase
MLSAARASFPDFRRYLRAKAAVFGAERLPWYDLFAPVGDASAARAFLWPEAETFVSENFGAYSEKMRAFAERTFRERWIDAEPRPGKRDGAFCMGIRADESRILQNYRPSFDGVSTLAHELGHAYHNTCLAGRTYLQRGTPMTLAETASIFCETIIRQAALATASPAEQVVILEGALQGDCQVVVDITSRFLFESYVFEKRQERELSVDELCRAMRDAQRETYGDGLDENLLHPYMWAMKPHYYGSSFYNFPYMFGLLFGLGLYAEYRRDPERFRARYDDLLSSTGMEDASALASGFGIDIRDEAFWASSLGVIRADIDQLITLLGSK